MGEGRTTRVWFSFLHFVPPWFSLLFRPWVSTFLPLFIFRANSLAPFDTLLTSNHLPISLLRHLGTRSQGKRGGDHSGFFRLQGRRGALGSLCLLSARMHLWKEMRVHGTIRQLVSASSGCWPGNILCWERAPPMAKVMRKEAWHMQRRDQASGVSLEILEQSTPKTRVCLLSALCFHLHL